MAVRSLGSLGVTQESRKNKQFRSEEHTNSSALSPDVCMFVCDEGTLGYLAFSSREGKHS